MSYINLNPEHKDPVVIALAGILVIGARKDRYLQLFSKTSDKFQREAEDLVKWAMKVLQKEDRILWFIKRVRLTDREYRKADPKGEEEWNRERGTGGLATERKPIEYLQEKLEHYIGNAEVNKYAKILNYTFKPNENVKSVLTELEKLESEAFDAKHDRYLAEGDETFIDLGNGWEWQIIDQTYCEREGRAMKHCGNKQSAKEGDQVLSLREKVLVDERGVWKPHATFILNNGVLGEMKGFNNTRPAPELHPQIIKLLEDERIKEIKGGGYRPSANFKVSKLTEQEIESLKAKRPDLIAPFHQTPAEEVIEEIEEADNQTIDYYLTDPENDYASDLGNRGAGRLDYYTSLDVEYELKEDTEDFEKGDVIEDAEALEYLIEKLKQYSSDWESELVELAGEPVTDVPKDSFSVDEQSVPHVLQSVPEDILEQLKELNEDELVEVERNTNLYDIHNLLDSEYPEYGVDISVVWYLPVKFDDLIALVEGYDKVKELDEDTDPEEIDRLAIEDKSRHVRFRALELTKNQKVLQKAAMKDKAEQNRKMAVNGLENQGTLKQIAAKPKEKSYIRALAVDKIEDIDFLKKLLQKTEEDYFVNKQITERLEQLE